LQAQRQSTGTAFTGEHLSPGCCGRPSLLQLRFDPSIPYGRRQDAPPTEEYKNIYQQSLDDQALDEEGSGVYDLLEVEPVRAGQLLRGVFLGCGTTAIFEEL